MVEFINIQYPENPAHAVGECEYGECSQRVWPVIRMRLCEYHAVQIYAQMARATGVQLQLESDIRVRMATKASSAAQRHEDLLIQGEHGNVYFAQLGSLIKIGYSTDVRSRCANLNAKLLVAMRGTRADEAKMHRRFHQYRTRGEWFEAGPELVDYINDLRKWIVPQNRARLSCE